MFRRNIRPCSICAGVSATSMVNRCGPVALMIVSSDVAKRWSWALAEETDRLAIVAAQESSSIRRVVMRCVGVSDRRRWAESYIERLGDDGQISAPRDTCDASIGLDRCLDRCGRPAGPHRDDL